MKKLSAKQAKACAAVLIGGLFLMLVGCSIPDSFFFWQLVCIGLGTAAALAAAAVSLLLFRCPHCGRGKVSPLWFREYHCPVCGEKILWE